MSDLISRSALIEALMKEEKECENCMIMPSWYSALRIVENTPTVEAKPVEWIHCGERMPKERESIFKKIKGTDKWNNGMFEGISDDVNVTVEYEDGTTRTMTSHTLDGKWECEIRTGIKKKVIAWMPLPAPYNADMRKKVE